MWSSLLVLVSIIRLGFSIGGEGRGRGMSYFFSFYHSIIVIINGWEGPVGRRNVWFSYEAAGVYSVASKLLWMRLPIMGWDGARNLHLGMERSFGYGAS